MMIFEAEEKEQAVDLSTLKRRRKRLKNNVKVIPASWRLTVLGKRI